MTFPTANSRIYRNEAGEVLGWDNESSYEPEYCDICGYRHSDNDCDEDEGEEDDDEEAMEEFLPADAGSTDGL